MSRSGKDVGKLRFFVDVDVASNSVIIEDAHLLAQWRTVLRLKEGNEVVLIDPTGVEAVAVIAELTKKNAVLTIVDRHQNNNEPAREVTLYCAMLKRENFEWVAQKAVETGVTRLVPMMTERTVKLGFKRERLETIMREAAEQSGRGKIPALNDPLSFEQAVADSAPINSRYFFDVGATVQPKAANMHAVALFVGPEGGWSEGERAQAATSGMLSVGLGNRVLRAETAAVIATYLFAA